VKESLLLNAGSGPSDNYYKPITLGNWVSPVVYSHPWMVSWNAIC